MIKVLFVCLGNICRSPAAEGGFLHLLEERGLNDQFVVDSAGTGGWHVGNPADRRMQAAANRRGIQLPSRARQISVDDFSSFDQVLTMADEDNHINKNKFTVPFVCGCRNLGEALRRIAGVRRASRAAPALHAARASRVGTHADLPERRPRGDE